MDEIPLRADVVMEEAQWHESRSQEISERLETVSDAVGEIVRAELHAAFAEEFQALGAASARAAEALSAVRRAASVRVALWAIGVAAACSAVPAMVAWTLLPTRAQLEHLRRDRARLVANVARLRRAGGRIELRRCGSPGRLCVRVERDSPSYGPHGDFLIVKKD